MITFKWYRIVVEIKHIHLDKAKVLSKRMQQQEWCERFSISFISNKIGLDSLKRVENAYNFKERFK